MVTYSNKFGSKFPTNIIEQSNYTDLTTELYPIAKKYIDYCTAGQLESAAILRSQNPMLDKCIIDAKVWNHISEEIYNTQVYALNAGQLIIVSPEEPLAPQNGLVWIGGDE